MSAHEEEVLGKAYDARLMRRLLTYLRPYRGQVLVATLAIVGHSALELVPPYLTKIVIDRYVPARDAGGVLAVAAVRPDWSEAGCMPMSAKRFTVACCRRRSAETETPPGVRC